MKRNNAQKKSSADVQVSRPTKVNSSERCRPITQSINQSKNVGGLSNGTTGISAISTGHSQLMSSKWSGKDFLNRCVLRRRRNVVNDSADVTSSG